MTTLPAFFVESVRARSLCLPLQSSPSMLYFSTRSDSEKPMSTAMTFAGALCR